MPLQKGDQHSLPWQQLRRMIPNNNWSAPRCLLFPILFNIFLERTMAGALEGHEGTVSIGGRTITNLRFADDIDGLAGQEQELVKLVNHLEEASTAYGMQISAEMTQMMTNNTNGIITDITVDNKKLETVRSFKLSGSYSIRWGIYAWSTVQDCPDYCCSDQTKSHLERQKHPRRRNVTTSMVGLKNGHMCKHLTKMVNPRDRAGEHRRRRREQEHRHQLQDQTDAFPGHVNICVCMWNVDHNSKHWKKDTGIGDWGVSANSSASRTEISAKTECDYLNGWIKKWSHTQKSHPKSGEPQRYSWATNPPPHPPPLPKKKKKKTNKKKRTEIT